MTDSHALLPGTLELLILKALSLGEQHGYGVLLRVEQLTGGTLIIEQGALYPRCIGSSIGVSSIRSGAHPTIIAAQNSTA